MYVNRRGKIVISGIPVMDNGTDSFHDGLVRVVRNGKYGFANRRGHVVIPPIYDGVMNFEKGRAEVCKGCESKCDDRDIIRSLGENGIESIPKGPFLLGHIRIIENRIPHVPGRTVRAIIQIGSKSPIHSSSNDR